MKRIICVVGIMTGYIVGCVASYHKGRASAWHEANVMLHQQFDDILKEHNTIE